MTKHIFLTDASKNYNEKLIGTSFFYFQKKEHINYFMYEENKTLRTCQLKDSRKFEFIGIINCIEYIVLNKIQNPVIFSDSKGDVENFYNLLKSNKGHSKKFFFKDIIRYILQYNIRLRWIRRSLNTLADTRSKESSLVKLGKRNLVYTIHPSLDDYIEKSFKSLSKDKYTNLYYNYMTPQMSNQVFNTKNRKIKKNRKLKKTVDKMSFTHFSFMKKIELLKSTIGFKKTTHVHIYNTLEGKSNFSETLMKQSSSITYLWVVYMLEQMFNIEELNDEVIKLINFTKNEVHSRSNTKILKLKTKARLHLKELCV